MSVAEYFAIAMGVIMLILILGVPPIVIAGVAERRGRDPELWQFITLIIPLFPLLYLLSVPPLDELEDDDLLDLP